MASKSSEVPLTLVLMGRTGNGKSATGNSILGRPVFKSKRNSSAVTMTCEMESATLPDGRKIRVIDTPGFFEVERSHQEVINEIIKCVDCAKDGIHGVLMVLSIKNRLTMEEKAVVDTVQFLFGNKVVDFVIVVFTAVEELDENETLDDYCGDGPDALKKLLNECGDRKIGFDNRTKDQSVKDRQVAQLLKIVDKMVRRNGNKPYTNDLFEEARLLAEKAKQHKEEVEAARAQGRDISTDYMEKMEQAHAQQLQSMMAVIEERMRKSEEMFKEKFAEERRRSELAEKRASELEEKNTALLNQLVQAQTSSRPQVQHFPAIQIPCPIM